MLPCQVATKCILSTRSRQQSYLELDMAHRSAFQWQIGHKPGFPFPRKSLTEAYICGAYTKHVQAKPILDKLCVMLDLHVTAFRYSIPKLEILSLIPSQKAAAASRSNSSVSTDAMTCTSFPPINQQPLESSNWLRKKSLGNELSSLYSYAQHQSPETNTLMEMVDSLF